METRNTGMAALEEEARTLGQTTAQGALHRTLLSWVKSIAWPSEVEDSEEGGEPYRLVRWARLQINTMVGPIEITVPSYEKNGKESLRPVEAALGIRKSISPLLEKMCGSIGAELPFALSEKEVAELTQVRVSRSTINRVCCELGEVAKEDQGDLKMPTGFGEAVKVTVQMDGGRVNTGEGWKEPRLAHIEVTNTAGKNVAFLLTGIVCAEAFWGHVTQALQKLGLTGCAQMAFIGDGAKWILQGAAERFKQALCILDFYHAAEHIHEAARELFGETIQAKAWARRYVRLMRRGHFRKILEAWRPSDRAPIKALIEYFEPRLNQVRYRLFRRRGFPIGSGRIEGVVKQVVNLRLKRNGAEWTLQNAERMLALRAAKIFGRLDMVWQRRTAARIAEGPAAFATLLKATPVPNVLLPKRIPSKDHAA
jgi:hypothetical protein